MSDLQQTKPIFDLDNPWNSSWDGFLTHESGRFDSGVHDLNSKLEQAMDALTHDPANPTYLSAYQTALSEYTLYRNAQSNVVKVYKDVASAIVSNFR